MRILIVLNQHTEALRQVEGFDWDDSYGVIRMNETSFLYRGTLSSTEAQKEIEQWSFFVSLWEDSSVGPAVITQTEITKTKTIHENATKEELEKFLTYAEENGKDTALYRTWLLKMTDSEPLPKPVYGKMIGELGIEYDIT